MPKIQLTTQQIASLCAHFGIEAPKHGTQRIIIDIDLERTVHIYTKALLRDQNLDFINILMEGKPIPTKEEEIRKCRVCGRAVVKAIDGVQRCPFGHTGA